MWNAYAPSWRIWSHLTIIPHISPRECKQHKEITLLYVNEQAYERTRCDLSNDRIGFAIWKYTLKRMCVTCHHFNALTIDDLNLLLSTDLESLLLLLQRRFRIVYRHVPDKIALVSARETDFKRSRGRSLKEKHSLRSADTTVVLQQSSTDHPWLVCTFRILTLGCVGPYENASLILQDFFNRI